MGAGDDLQVLLASTFCSIRFSLFWNDKFIQIGPSFGQGDNNGTARFTKFGYNKTRHA